MATQPIQRHVMHSIPEPTTHSGSKYIDYQKLRIQQVGPPTDRFHLTEKRRFIASLKPGDSFLVPHKHAGPLVTAINKTFGKAAGAKRQVDLEYSRVYRVH